MTKQLEIAMSHKKAERIECARIISKKTGAKCKGYAILHPSLDPHFKSGECNHCGYTIVKKT